MPVHSLTQAFPVIPARLRTFRAQGPQICLRAWYGALVHHCEHWLTRNNDVALVEGKTPEEVKEYFDVFFKRAGELKV